MLNACEKDKVPPPSSVLYCGIRRQVILAWRFSGRW